MPFDFTKFDAYLGTIGLIVYEDENSRATTQPIPLQAPRADFFTPSRFESSPGFGDRFSQGDFSHGAGQERFHEPNRDERKFYSSEGYDISVPGRLTHLHATAEAFNSTTVGRSIEIVQGLPFIIDNVAATQHVRRGDGNFPGAWTPEDPFAGEGVVNIEGLASSGDELYAALGIRGIHKRSQAGTWAHHVDAGATGIDRVAWAKDRLFGSDGRNIYEITASGPLPEPLETLALGWKFVDIFEMGAYVYACAVDEDTGMSRIHHYGLRQDGAALEKKGSTSLPIGQLAYVGKGYLNFGYIGGGVRNSSNGLDPVVYQAFQDAQGFLSLVKLVEEEGAGSADLSVRGIEPIGEGIVFSWSLGSGAPTGARTGLAIHHLDRDSLAHYLKGPAGAARVEAVRFYKGRLLFVVNGDGLFYEDVGTFVTTAELVSSIADWHHAGHKVWDLFEVGHSALAASEIVELLYSTKHPDESAFTSALVSDTDGAEGKSVQLTNVKARQLAVKVKSTGVAAGGLEVYRFSIRANPTPDSSAAQEFLLTRHFRIFAEDRKDEQAAEVVTPNPEMTRNALQDLAGTFQTFAEPGVNWTAYVQAVVDIMPSTPVHQTALGEDKRKAFIVQIQMIARKAA
jgi:hypothetical protein